MAASTFGDDVMAKPADDLPKRSTNERPRRRRRDADSEVVPQEANAAYILALVFLGKYAAVVTVLVLVVVFIIASITPFISKTRDSAARLQSNDNLKQCVFAVHSFHDLHGKLP